MAVCYHVAMKKIKPAPQKREEHAPRGGVKVAEKSRAASRVATSSAARPRASSRKGSKSPAPAGGWLARRPARPIHPATPIDEMAGLVIIAGALLLALIVLAPDAVGALAPFGHHFRDAAGQGGLVMAFFVLLLGAEAFTPHQALGLPMLAIALSILFLCLEGLADLMGGQGGQIGAIVGAGVRAAVGIPGAWITLVTAALIDLQWITRVSLRGPARWLFVPFRWAGRGARLGLRVLASFWMAGTRGLWAFADGVMEGGGAASDEHPAVASDGFVPPVTVGSVAGGAAKPSTARPAPAAASLAPKAESSKTSAPALSPSPTSTETDPSADLASTKKRGRDKTETASEGPVFPDFPPLPESEESAPPASVEAPLVVAEASRLSPPATDPPKPVAECDDDLEIPGYEDDGPSDAIFDEEPVFDDLDESPEFEDVDDDDDEPPFDLASASPLTGADDPDRTAELTRAWADQESPGVQALSLPPPDGTASRPPRNVSYTLPSVDLLNAVTSTVSAESAVDFSRVIVETLNSFGVATRIVNVEKGPTVTRYELQPARGVKVSKITSLNNDIALALAAQAIRIEAPIPGKSAIGIEVPNSRVDAVPMREIIESQQFQGGQGCMLALGKDISGRAVVADLLRMPHLLIAGATGSGKSVCLNTVIVSMLYRFTPQQVQMVMVDPKRVELSIFEGIPHLANTNTNPNQRIVKDAKGGTLVLKQATEIMNQRFELLSQNRVRNIAEYNAKVETPMPYLVIIVDELAQLMQISARSVEGYLQELAQMGRAAGIHLILATQRPSVDVLTGTIKSNFPARIAFAVSAQVDSRTILDRGGAEKLLGRGDMLFSPTDAELRRVQGCLITLEETERVVDFWRQQEAPDNLAQLSLDAKTTDDLLGASGGEGGDDEDLLREALRVIKDTKLASASNLQRKLQIGYPRAARLVDELENRGFLGPANGSKPRKILFLEDVE